MDKSCSKCSEVLPLTAFYKRASTGAYRAACKSCTNTSTAKWNAANKEKKRKDQAVWSRANKHKVREYSRAYYSRNKAEESARCKRWRAENADKVRQIYTGWVRRCPDRYAARNFASSSNVRAKRYGCRGRLNTEQVLSLWAYYGNRCVDCGVYTRELDHVKPLAVGGYNLPANLQCVCRDCNLTRWSEYVSGCS